MLPGKTKLGKFYPVVGLFLPNQIPRAVTQWKVKKKVGHMILGKSMLGKFCPTSWPLLPNLFGKKVMNIHSLIHVRARGIPKFNFVHIICCLYA